MAREMTREELICKLDKVLKSNKHYMNKLDDARNELEEVKKKHAATLWEYCDSVKKEDYDALKAEHEKALKQIEHDRVKMNDLVNEIDCKRMKLPPEEPIGAAAWLINAKRKRDTNSLQRFFHSSERYEDYDMYSISDLREIAEHLLAYCKNQKSAEAYASEGEKEC